MHKRQILLTVIISIFIIFVLIQINKPLTGEEPYFVYAADSIINKEDLMINFDGYGFPKILALAHPPFYLYTLAASISWFGHNLISYKLSGIIFTILTSLIIFFFLDKKYPDKKIPIIAASLYLIHPLVIQSSTFIDIDGGILTFFTTLSLLYYLTKDNSLKFGIILSFFLALVLWTKFTSFVILAVSILVHQLFRKNKIKNITYFVTILFSALILFLISFYLYTSFNNLDFSKPFTQNSVEKFSERIDLSESILRSAATSKNLFFWITPPLLFTFILFLFKDINRFVKRNIDNKRLFLWIYLLVSSSFFVFLGINYSGFAKHFVILIPAMSILFAQDIVSIITDKVKPKIILISGLILIYYLLFVGDPIATQDIWTTISQFNSGLIFSIMLKAFLILLPIVFLYFFFKRLDYALILVSLLFLVYCSVYTSLVNYSTTVNYGDRETEEVVDLIKDNEKSNIIAPHHIIFILNEGKDYSYSENGYFYVDRQYYLYPYEFWNNFEFNNHSTYLIIYKRDIGRTEGFEEDLDEKFNLVKEFEKYNLYKMN